MDEIYQKFSETVSKVFPAYAEAPTKIGFSLTAGLDTRAMMASLKSRKESLPCYTFGGTWGELYDIRTARKIAAIYNEPFNAIKLDGEFWRDSMNSRDKWYTFPTERTMLLELTMFI